MASEPLELERTVAESVGMQTSFTSSAGGAVVYRIGRDSEGT